VDYLKLFYVVELEIKIKLVTVQPHLIKQINQIFEQETRGKRKSEVPESQIFKIRRSTEVMEIFDTDAQREYCSRVGMIFP
jgi:hypothetical protein